MEEVAETTVSAAEQKDWQSALDLLEKAEKLLEAVTAEGMRIDPELILCTLHNLASCHQQ